MLNLVVCLMAARQPVARERIVQLVPGYSDAPSPAALERMFERDKDELRSLGIPIETVLDASGDVEGYRIPRDRYAMAAITFSAEERAALLVAATVWREAVLGPTALQAVRKIQSLDPGPAAIWEQVADAQLTASDAAVLAILRAIRQQRSIRFDYQPPQNIKPMRRTVDPWGIVTHEGAWYLVGHDHERSDARVFRISRMVGSVQGLAQEQRVTVPDGEDLGRRVRMEPHDESVTATVRVRSGAGGGLRRLARDQRPFEDVTIDVVGASQDWLAAEICAAGNAAEVVSPNDMRDAVRVRLEHVMARHGLST